MATPLISIIIPCFNQGRFLGEAIRSVRATERLPAEIIVVDDGSTGETPAVAAGLHVIYRYQPNSGIATARNRGLAESRGDLLVFLDSDDMLAPDALETGASALDANPGCAFATGRCVMMDASGRLMPTPEQPRITGDAYSELLRHNFIWMPAMAMFRRAAVLEIGGFNPHDCAAADYDLYLRMARRWPGHDHTKVVAYYRQHGANMSTNASRMLRETLRVHGRERPYAIADRKRLSAFREGRRRWREFYGTRLVEEIRAHVRSREWRTAARKTVTLARYHPEGLRHHALRKLSLLVTRHRAVRDPL
jgi:glycosyltransferase involved in cell wall biosynthesis